MAEIKTLKDGSIRIAPRTKTKAITDDSGKNLDDILTSKADAAKVPTTTSDLTNDSGFITKEVGDLVNYTKSAELANVATSGKYSDLIGKPIIPSKTSDLSNDSGFITKDVNNLTNYALSASLAGVAMSGEYNDLLNKPTIPTKVSDLNNDSGFITNAALESYSTTSEMNAAISAYHDDTKQDKLATQSAYQAKGSGTKVAQITTNSLGQVTNIDEVEIAKTTLGDMGVSATATELNILDGATLSTVELNYVDGVTSNIQDQLDNKEAKDSTILKQSNVVDNVESVSAIYPLSAKQGKELQAQINNLKNIGRFLALWDCTTGQPLTQPESLPYTYHTGDYYRISVVASDGGTNYRPYGTSYTGAASTLEETGVVNIGSVYYFDGTTWLSQSTSGGESGVQDVQINGTSIVDANVANITKAKLGLDNVENKSSETIRSEITVDNIPYLPASKITSGTFADARIASASVWNAKQDSLTGQTAYTNKGTSTKVPQISTNELGQVTKITEVDITKTTLSDLGVTASASELNYSSGVTSAIQTQLDDKQDSSALGDLAFKDSASGTITPSGSISAPIITMFLNTADVESVTDAGTLPSFTQGEDSFTQGSFEQGTDIFTQGSFTQGTDKFTQGTFSAGTLPTFGYSVVDENLTFSFTQGTLPSHSSDSFTQGTDSFTKPTFSQGTDKFTKPTFTRGVDTFKAGTLPTSKTISVVTNASANAGSPLFKGDEVAVEVK